MDKVRKIRVDSRMCLVIGDRVVLQRSSVVVESTIDVKERNDDDVWSKQ